MEDELGPICIRATILTKPVLCKKTGKVKFRARFNYSGCLVNAKVKNEALLELEAGEEIFLSGYGDEVCDEFIRHNRFVRWFILTFC